MSDDNLIGRPSAAGAHVSLRSMQEVAMNDRNASKMLSTYNVAYWGVTIMTSMNSVISVFVLIRMFVRHVSI